VWTLQPADIASLYFQCTLQITRAAITTSTGGSVYDVFEIHYEPGSLVSALDVQCQLHSVLYSNRIKMEQDAGADLKRQRSQ
jgi:hypothetical protein